MKKDKNIVDPQVPGRKTKRDRERHADKSNAKKGSPDNENESEAAREITHPITNQDEQRQITNAGPESPMSEAEREGV